MNQQTLFEIETAAAEAVAAVCRDDETADNLSQMGDKRRVRRLPMITDRLERATEPLARAKLATQVRDLAEAIVEEAILDANRAGLTWRDIGAGLGVPFQTLYRRYGANR